MMNESIISKLDIERLWKLRENREKRKQVLVVAHHADSPRMDERSELIQLVGEMGLGVEWAFSGREALLALFFEKPKLVILNPVAKGALNLRLLETIKKTDPGIKVVLAFEDEYRFEIFSDPRWTLADGFITNPMSAERRKELMSRILQNISE